MHTQKKGELGKYCKMGRKKSNINFPYPEWHSNNNTHLNAERMQQKNECI